MQQMPLKTLLQTLDEQHWNHWVYIPDDVSVDAETPCIVYAGDIDEDLTDNGIPLKMHQLGQVEFLMIADLQDVQQNLEQQKPSTTFDDLLNATLYFFRNDAFIQM